MASLIPGYNYDIFISYRQKDNKGDKWVSEFVDALKDELESTFKEEISVYFDINPHDGLLESHDVGDSLKEKLKCLVFIPIISRTYCDPKSFAWEHEFRAFVEQASQDQFELKVRLANGNVANRILPIRIHDIENEDKKLFESVVGGVLRSIDFVYKETGVNRQLRTKDDDIIKSPTQILYRDQINKVALATKDIIEGIKVIEAHGKVINKITHVKDSSECRDRITEEPFREKMVKPERLDQIGKNRKLSLPRNFRIMPVIIVVSLIFILVLFGIKLIQGQKKKHYARYELIPQIQKLVEENLTTQTPSEADALSSEAQKFIFQAYELLTEAQKYLPDDSRLINLWQQITEDISLHTQPEGARVFWKEYNRPSEPWKEIGITPFENFKVPNGYKRIKIEKEGFQTILITRFSLFDLNQSLKLDSNGLLPPKMVRIPSRNTQMYITGLEKYGGKRVGEFLVDQYEVTNKEYKRFVDSGGYSNKNYWNVPIYKESKEISWESAMDIFIDKTGKQGPSGWEVGTYPDGREDFPVSGISWYEASAYAVFMGKKLPNVYQWSVVAETFHSMLIIPMSNFNRNSTVPVGNMDGMSSYGIYDLAGNVREWCYNGTGENGLSYILGGSYNDPEYSFNEPYFLPAIDRSLSNGFRCIMEVSDDSTIGNLSAPIKLDFRDYNKEKPVDGKDFNIFLRQYAYDKSPLNEQLITESDTGTYKIEKVTIDAGYKNDRLILYLYLPRYTQPPYQPIIYFPGSGAIYMDMTTSNLDKRLEFIIKSGRVLIFPVYQGTFARKDGLKSDLQEETVFYKDHVIMWRKDFGRTIDYLETRNDILSDKIGYFGWSWGGFMGGIIPAVEKRIKAVVLLSGGMEMQNTFPEVDPINFLPRVYQPVLMMNGRYDAFFPLETSQMPMFNLLGTPATDKKIIIYNSGHQVPRTETIKETLSWYDKYLGPVK